MHSNSSKEKEVVFEEIFKQKLISFMDDKNVSRVIFGIKKPNF